MTAYRNVLETIGKTPLVEVTRLDSGLCRLFLKLENQNPGGSIKDRIALSMIEAAERDGSLTVEDAFIQLCHIVPFRSNTQERVFSNLEL